MSDSPIAVLGAGSWGTALAIVLAGNGHLVYLWGRDAEHILAMKNQKCNKRYMPEVNLPENLQPTDDLEFCLRKSTELIIAVPSIGMPKILEMILQHGQKNIKLCLANKGLVAGIQRLNHKIVEDCLGQRAETVILSGPSFAKEVAVGLPTAVTIAGHHAQTTNLFAGKFHNAKFRTYIHDDIIGAQIGGAVKNIMAIAAGITDGLGFGQNAQSALITRGLAETVRLGVALGGRQETFMGLTGLGDLVLTCCSNQSRNRRFGIALSKGATLATASKKINQAIEGIDTVHGILKLAVKNDIEMPITKQISAILNGDISPRDAVELLLSRTQKRECDQ